MVCIRKHTLKLQMNNNLTNDITFKQFSIQFLCMIICITSELHPNQIQNVQTYGQQDTTTSSSSPSTGLLTTTLTSSHYTPDSLISEVIEKEYKKEGLEENTEEDQKLMKKNRIKTLKQWKELTDVQKSKYPDGLVLVLDEAAKTIEGMSQI